MSTLTQQSKIHTAIIKALTAAEMVTEAVEEVERLGPAAIGPLSSCPGLARYEVTAECFVPCEVDKLRKIATALDQPIRLETLIWFVHDDCDLDGPHEVSEMSELGKRLAGLRNAIWHLADQLSLVVKSRRAEQIEELLS